MNTAPRNIRETVNLAVQRLIANVALESMAKIIRIYICIHIYLRLCLVDARRMDTYQRRVYAVSVGNDITKRVRSPWYSTTVAAYLEDRFLKVWGVCAFTPVQLMGSAKGTGSINLSVKARLLTELHGRWVKMLPRALKALEDQHRFCSFQNGIVAESLLQPDPSKFTS